MKVIQIFILFIEIHSLLSLQSLEKVQFDPLFYIEKSPTKKSKNIQLKKNSQISLKKENQNNIGKKERILKSKKNDEIINNLNSDQKLSKIQKILEKVLDFQNDPQFSVNVKIDYRKDFNSKWSDLEHEENSTKKNDQNTNRTLQQNNEGIKVVKNSNIKQLQQAKKLQDIKIQNMMNRQDKRTRSQMKLPKNFY